MYANKYVNRSPDRKEVSVRPSENAACLVSFLLFKAASCLVWKPYRFLLKYSDCGLVRGAAQKEF